jgi:hypothetical protein
MIQLKKMILTYKTDEIEQIKKRNFDLGIEPITIK